MKERRAFFFFLIVMSFLEIIVSEEGRANASRGEGQL